MFILFGGYIELLACSGSMLCNSLGASDAHTTVVQTNEASVSISRVHPAFQDNLDALRGVHVTLIEGYCGECV